MKLVQCFIAVFAVGASGVVLAQSAPASCVPIDALPLTISAPGKYCFTQSFLVDRTGITIAADDVTIDLNGHSLRYIGLPRGTAIGINRYAAADAPDLFNITIRNGTISNFYDGVSLHKISNVVIEDLRIHGDPNRAVFGIDLYNARGPAIIRNNQIANVNWGIQLRGAIGSLIENNIVQLVGTDGRQVGISLEFASGGTLVRSNIIRNASGSYGTGIIAYSTVPEATFIDNNISGVRNGISGNTPGIKYRDNVVSGAVTPYRGGTDIGGNN